MRLETTSKTYQVVVSVSFSGKDAFESSMKSMYSPYCAINTVDALCVPSNIEQVCRAYIDAVLNYSRITSHGF